MVCEEVMSRGKGRDGSLWKGVIGGRREEEVLVLKGESKDLFACISH